MTQKMVGNAMDNPYKCRLTLLTPAGKAGLLQNILAPLTAWVDPSQQVIAIEERDGCNRSGSGRPTDRRKLKECMVTPALSVMMFMKETGPLCVNDVQRVLKRAPWRFHHKVELQQRSFPQTALAKQEFFKLSKDLPLFAACPVPTEQEHLRINLYVHNYPAMVEFYRTVTETEIETSKPEFCIFKLYHQPGLDIQLSLKRSPYLFPVPVECACVSFNVTNMGLVKTHYDVKHVGNNVYSTRDPDGNLVVLCESVSSNQDPHTDSFTCKHNRNSHVKDLRGVQDDCVKLAEIVFSQDDMKSMRSVSEIDSGRYSDVDGAGPELPASETVGKCRAPIIVSSINGRKTDDSDGYSSSLSHLTLDVDTKRSSERKQSDSNCGILTKQSHSESQDGVQDNTASAVGTHSRYKHITPVYI